MQTKLVLALVSLALGTALASPVDEDWHRTGEQESEFGNSNGVFQQEEAGSDNSEVMRGEDGVELSQFYINEIRKQLEAPRSSVGEEDEQRNKRSTGRGNNLPTTCMYTVDLHVQYQELMSRRRRQGASNYAL